MLKLGAGKVWRKVQGVVSVSFLSGSLDGFLEMRIKIPGPVFLEGFDATLSREEGKKLTRMVRRWVQIELLRDPSDRVWLRAQERGYFLSSHWIQWCCILILDALGITRTSSPTGKGALMVGEWTTVGAKKSQAGEK